MVHRRVVLHEPLPDPIHQSLRVESLYQGKKLEQVWTHVDDDGGGNGNFLQISGEPVYEGDQIVAVFCLLDDLTPQIEREEALHHSMRDREAMVDALTGLVFHLERDGTIGSATSRSDDVWSHLNANLRGASIHALRPPELAKLIWGAAEEIFDHRGAHKRLLEFDSEIDDVPIACRALLVITGNRQVLVHIVDVSERRLVDEWLRLSQFAVDHAHDTVLITSHEGEVFYANEAALRELHYEGLDQILGTPYEAICPMMDAQAWEELLLDLEGAVGVNFEATHRRRDGVECPVDVSASMVVSGTRRYVCVFARDITQRQIFEQEFRAYTERLEQSNRELEDFAHVASHDLQEPIRKIMAFGDRLEAMHGDDIEGRGKDYLDRMRRAAARMSRLIDDLLSFSRVSRRTDTFGKVELDRVVRDVLMDVEMRIQESGAVIHVGRLPTIEADPTQMSQLFQNLILNALKFTLPRSRARDHDRGHTDHRRPRSRGGS